MEAPVCSGMEASELHASNGVYCAGSAAIIQRLWGALPRKDCFYAILLTLWTLQTAVADLLDFFYMFFSLLPGIGELKAREEWRPGLRFPLLYAVYVQWLAWHPKAFVSNSDYLFWKTYSRTCAQLSIMGSIGGVKNKYFSGLQFSHCEPK